MAAPATAQTAVAAIGDLELTYDAADWDASDGTTISCISAACLGAVVDVTILEAAEYCDRDVAYAEAAASFPNATRHAANMHAIGELALFFARSRISVDEDAGWAVFACITRAGVRYEFRSRVADRALPALQDGAVFELLAGLSAPSLGTLLLDLGGISVAYSADRWEATGPDETGTGTWILNCLPPFCAAPTPVFLSAAPITPDIADPCGETLADNPRDTQFTEIPAGGLSFRLGTTYSMCRAATPPELSACAVHDGVRYLLGTGSAQGCYFGPSVPTDLFVELVQSILPSP